VHEPRLTPGTPSLRSRKPRRTVTRDRRGPEGVASRWNVFDSEGRWIVEVAMPEEMIAARSKVLQRLIDRTQRLQTTMDRQEGR